jgi:TonB-dependent starch-binding outer membrane protein SusC
MTKFYRILCPTLLLLCLLATQSSAQSRTITGKVTSSDDGSALPGVNILEKGTTNGSVTDADGNYSIVVNDKATLVYSFVGYATQEVEVGAQTSITITLSPDIATLSEVLVVGYGAVKKSDATGAVGLVDSKEFNKGVVNSPQELLIGKTAGVVITSNSGAPGNTSTIRIRGGSSLGGGGASNDPLIVIDGVPISNDNLGGSPNILTIVNPNDIETFTVLKDASATAIYGLRASNGVILITTKRGGRKFKVSYTATGTVSTAPKKVDVYSASEFRELIQEQYPTEVGLLTDADTDWQREIYEKSAFSQDHNVNVSGTALKTPYRVSVGYNNSDGILKTYNFKRTSASIGLDPTLFNDKLKVSINLKGMINDNNFADQAAIGSAITYDPTKPVMNGNTRWRGYTTWTQGGINGAPNTLATGNPVARLDLTDNTSTVKRSIGNIKFDYDVPLIKQLRATLNLGYDYSETVGHNNVMDSTQWIIIAGGGQRSEYSNNAKNQLLDFYLTYNKDLKSVDSRIEVIGGYSWSHFYRSNTDTTTNYYAEEKAKLSNPREYFLLSLFGKLSYTFKDKYLFTATLRNDATSRFSRDQRNGLFPSIALGWKIKEEAFMRDVSFISDLKLRAGYGVTGQQDIANSDYPYIATYTISSSTANYQLGNTLYPTLRPNAFNNMIKWETTETANVGIDFGFMQNKITGSLDVYQKKSVDLIVFARTAKGTNFGSEVISNIGTITNNGVELNLNAEVVSRDDFQWIVGYNVSYNKNEVTRLTANGDPDYYVATGGLGCSTCGSIQAQKVGNPRSAFIVYQQVYDDNGMPLQDVYVDRNDDGLINESDRYIYRKPDPSVLMGISSRLNYKNWDFAFMGRASFGNYVYNSVAANSTYSSISGVGIISNTTTHADKAKFKNATLERFSDFYVENASFFRLDNINMGYTFDNVYKERLKIRIGAGIQNVFVTTKYSGIDPEISGGIDNNFYPRTRSFFLNLNIEF